MTKTKEQFIDQMHEKVFKEWWNENQFLFPLVHITSARKIFISGREKMEKQFMKQKIAIDKSDRAKRELQSKIDKGRKNGNTETA